MDTVSTKNQNPRSPASQAVPLWVPARRWTAAVLLVAGIATLATSFAALPVPILVLVVAGWSVAVMVLAQSGHGPIGFLILSICVKVTTLFIIGLLIFDPASPIGAQNGLYWIPLGLLNMGSGLWFLKMIRRRAA
ncbi:hypothetical protein AL755_21975 [Arthrobacter sp. ERGS1:01]|uniref:hypothetical protein n=1 Tax=Arthrobacter sp. ERGS1:01 TaxID=1704044 RepID=UPI0006B4F4D5|nr:hypothetical protein [Arthrobacter sp. ERGS1:01]ALE07528.1 hypothetical protein AL755_21975 [Arthrobacter sp. ERGS1:01]